MKYSLFPKSLLLGTALFAAVVAPQIARATTIQFESASNLADFNQIANTTPSTNFTHSAAAGTNGSGGLVHAITGASDTTAIYTPSSFDLTTGAIHTISIDYKTGPAPISGNANAIVMLGFSHENSTAFYSNAGDAYIGGRIRRRSSSGGAEGLQSQTKIVGGAAAVTPADGSLADIAFATDNWYRFSLSVTRDGVTANQFGYVMTLLDLGPTGTGVPAPVVNGTLAGNFLNASLYNDTTAYAAFRGVPTVANGSVAFDNFTVPTLIPEPASVVLLGISLIGLLTRRDIAQG